MNAVTPKRINLNQLSEKARSQIQLILLREQAKKVVPLDYDDIARARAWTEGQTGGKGWGTNYRGFGRVMTKFVREDKSFRRTFLYRLTKLEKQANGTENKKQRRKKRKVKSRG